MPLILTIARLDLSGPEHNEFRLLYVMGDYVLLCALRCCLFICALADLYPSSPIPQKR